MPLFSKYQQRQQQQDSTPICRCRVLYLGSAVPHVTKDGLQGIQEPLRELYPEQGALGARGIDSWLSVWSNGLLLENVDENHKKVTRFFPIDSLHYCAAVRYVLVPEKSSSNTTTQPRFLPLDSPFARSPNPAHPPLFAAILRRTSGIKVLECHAFICKREAAANALVRCCFHAYADSSYARQMDGGSPPGAVGGGASGGSLYGTLCNGGQSASPPHSSNSFEKVEGWRRQANHNNNHVGGSTLTLNSTLRRRSPSEDNHNSNSNSNSNNNDNDAEVSHLELSNSADDISIYNGDENHKIWVGSSRDVSAERDALYGDYSTMRSSRSSRPRQNVNAPTPPPPPPPMKEDNKTKKAGGGGTKDRGRRKKFSEGTREEMYYMVNGDAPRRPNGYYGGGGAALKSSSSVSGGTMLRNYPMKCYPSAGSIYSNGGLRPASMNGFHHHHHPSPHGGGGAPIPPPPAQPVLMVPTTLPHPPRRLSAGSYNTNKKHHQPPPGLLVPVPPQAGGAGPINFFPIPGNGPAAATMFIPTGKKSSKFQPMPIPMMTASEEPIYMPSARPMSPVASYQPGHFPHEAYLMQQYAAFASLNGGDDDKKMKKKKKTKKKNEKSSNKKHSSSSSAIPPPPPLIDGHSLTSPHESAAHVDDDDDDDEADSSVYNSTGIYRRKGHLNERAFSYSIRQEHRSRSYGSLANLKFAPPPVIPNGNAIPPPPVALDVQNVPVNKQDLKKEREIMQMMHDLQLSGDELERSEVPPNVYQQNKIRAAKVRR